MLVIPLTYLWIYNLFQFESGTGSCFPVFCHHHQNRYPLQDSALELHFVLFLCLIEAPRPHRLLYLKLFQIRSMVWKPRDSVCLVCILIADRQRPYCRLNHTNLIQLKHSYLLVLRQHNSVILKKWIIIIVIIVKTYILPIKQSFLMVVKLLELFQKISHI